MKKSQLKELILKEFRKQKSLNEIIDDEDLEKVEDYNEKLDDVIDKKNKLDKT